MVLRLPTRNDPIARLALLVIFGLALLVNLQRFDRPIADARQEVVLTATPALPIPASFPESAPHAPVASQEAPRATAAPIPTIVAPPDPPAPVQAAPVEPAPIEVDVAPAAPVVEAPIVVVPEELSAPTIDPAPLIAAEPDQHGTKAAPERAEHYDRATAPDDNAPLRSQHGATLDPTSAARWCAAAASAGVAHCVVTP